MQALSASSRIELFLEIADEKHRTNSQQQLDQYADLEKEESSKDELGPNTFLSITNASFSYSLTVDNSMQPAVTPVTASTDDDGFANQTPQTALLSQSAPTLKGISFSVSASQVVMVVGPVGAGKAKLSPKTSTI